MIFIFGEDTIVDGDVNFTFVVVFVTITIGVHPTHDHFVFIVCCFGITSGFFSRNVYITSISMDWKKTHKQSFTYCHCYILILYFVQLPNLGGFVIKFEKSLWYNMLDKKTSQIQK